MKKRLCLLSLLLVLFLLSACLVETQSDSNQMLEEEKAFIEEEVEKEPEPQIIQEKEEAENSPQLFGPVTAQEAESGEFPVVYFIDEVSSESLMAVYHALDRQAFGSVAVKLHMGEPGGHNFLSPDLLKDFVLALEGTFVDSNTAYGGRRASTAMHLQAAEDHGFTAVAPVDILDDEGDFAIPVDKGKHLSENYVGSHLENYDFLVILSHFKGHMMGGFGGAIKNMSVGIASKKGKCLIHTAGENEKSMRGGIQNEFLESMAEAALSIADYQGENIIYINVMNNLSIDCDCDPHPAAPCMEDVGILASLDPVALDQACVDLIYASEDGQPIISRIEARNGILTLEHSQNIGLGSRLYYLVSLDD